MSELLTAEAQNRSNQLGRADWLGLALRVLIEDGIDAVQIAGLARRLTVTRGSFYWHFTSHEALLEAMLAEWRARNTDVMVDVLDDACSLDAGILALFAIWADHSKFDPALDQAVRDWARRSGRVRDLLAREDDSRITALTAFFERHDYPKIEAFIRARIIYFTQLSYYSLVPSEPMAERTQYLEAYFAGFTGRQINPALAASFIARLRAVL